MNTEKLAQYLVIDPCSHFLKREGVTAKNVVEATGLLFAWAAEAVIYDTPLFEHMNKMYFYPLSCGGLSKQESIDESGVLTYKGGTDEDGFVEPDEINYPLLRAETSKDVFYVYQHSMVIFINKETKEVTLSRMD